MIKKTVEGFLAGILISIGGTVYLSCSDKVVGSIFFSVALLCICYKGYSLFTGKVGYIPESHTRNDVSTLLWGLLGNAIGTALCGVLIAVTFPTIKEAAAVLSAAKLTQAFWQTLIRAFFCGILMYLAVSIFRDHKTPVAIFFCVPVFILSGFEHSIADMFYFAVGLTFSWRVALFLVLVLIGNSVGAMLMSLLRVLTAEKKS